MTDGKDHVLSQADALTKNQAENEPFHNVFCDHEKIEKSPKTHKKDRKQSDR